MRLEDGVEGCREGNTVSFPLIGDGTCGEGEMSGGEWKDPRADGDVRV